MTALYQLAPFPRSRSQHSILADFIDQEYACVVEIEPLANLVDSVLQQIVQIVRGGGVTGYFGGHPKFIGPALQVLGALGDPFF